MPSRERAQAAIRGGIVLVSGSVATKPARLVDPGEPITFLEAPHPYVSRGGEKLAGALEGLGVEPGGMRCLDVGSSTGGFTDCLLQRGASEVVACDVGRGQLDARLREDPRVSVLERTDVRELDPEALGAFDLVVCDLSFISLRTVLPHLAALAGRGRLLVLVKPQFEVGRDRVGKGGVVRDPELRAEAVDRVVRRAAEHGLRRLDSCESPLAGATGNREVFVLFRPEGIGDA